MIGVCTPNPFVERFKGDRPSVRFDAMFYCVFLLGGWYSVSGIYKSIEELVDEDKDVFVVQPCSTVSLLQPADCFQTIETALDGLVVLVMSVLLGRSELKRVIREGLTFDCNACLDMLGPSSQLEMA